MKKIILTTSLSLGVFFSGLIGIDAVQAEKDLETIQKERQDIDKKLTENEKELKKQLTEIKILNEEIDDLKSTIQANNKQIESVEEEIKELEEEIKVIEKRIEERFEILKERARIHQKNGGDLKYIEVLLGSANFNEFIGRVTAMNTITSSDADLIKLQEKDKQKIESILKEVELAKEELEDIKASLLEQKEISEEKKAKLKKKEKSYRDKVKELKLKDSKLEKLETEVLASMQPVAYGVEMASAGSAKGSGSLAWPTTTGYISSPMGTRNGRPHKGIDIARTDRSTSPPILAADAGTVVTTGDAGDGYGNKIIIDHGNGMRTLYAHLANISIRAGESVKKGQTLGVMGTTGQSTGIHLHFEVHVNGSVQNPMRYLR